PGHARRQGTARHARLRSERRHGRGIRRLRSRRNGEIWEDHQRCEDRGEVTFAASPMLDIFNHFVPKAYLDRLADLIPGQPAATAFPRIRPLWDIDARRALLDEFPGVQQILSLANPPLELVAPADKSPELARL